MGKPLASSKPKKNTEQNRRKRKNPKSRKRRRVSFPPSDTDDVPRHRKSSRRKIEIRRGRDRKRSVKKSRKDRHRSVSSMSRDSSSSCSTCDRKGKLKRKSMRGKKLDRVVRSLRSRNRSLSCSTCSGSSGSSQTYSNRDVKNKERDGEIDNEMVMKNYDDSQFCRANVDVVEEDRVMDEGFCEQGVEIDRWMSESNVENDSCFDQGGWAQADEPCKLSNRIKSEIVVANKHDSESDDLELMLRQKALENLKMLRSRLSSDNRITDEKKNELSGIESSEKSSETATKVVSLPKSPSTVSKELHIELGVLPSIEPKVKKLRSRLSSDNRTTDDKKNELSGIESSEKSSETATKVVSLPKSPSTVSKELHIELGVLPSIDPKVKPFIESPSVEVNYSTSDKKTLVSLLNQNRQSPCEGSQEKNASEGCGSGNNSLRSEVNLGDGKEKICEKNETVGECQSGSQFEQKTFSRMHDGEMVQVSYKVYIPNKTPALARRKLQR